MCVMQKGPLEFDLITTKKALVDLKLNQMTFKMMKKTPKKKDFVLPNNILS